MSTTQPTLIALAVALTEDAYLVRGDQALGPLPTPWWLDGGVMRRGIVITTAAIAALGLAWQPAAPLDLHPSGVWFTLQDGPDGGRYVDREYGYHQALSAFLASPEGQRWAQSGEPVRGAVPYLELLPDGTYRVGSDGLQAPVLLPLEPLRHLDTYLKSDLQTALCDRSWPEVASYR
jgi:hypothetical protein